MKTIKIGILGVALRTPYVIGGNLGCYALGYSFFEILSIIAKKESIPIEVVIIGTIGYKEFVKRKIKKILNYDDQLISYYKKQFPILTFSRGYYFYFYRKLVLGKRVKQCNCIFDFTAGDSFTDIYGKERFYTRTKLKKEIITAGIPLVLGSQTIGPFNDKVVEKYAVDVIEHCKDVYVRDTQSKSYVESISKIQPILTTDIAFFLPYKESLTPKTKRKAGFNPSGLLWFGGYNGDNQFNLTLDYKQYCYDIIEFLIDEGYEIHLILHAYFINDVEGFYHADNDRLAVEALHKRFPLTLVSPTFATPMEAKTYISNMDIFIGARMHATIAAISAGVPVIPFSYSRKFEGLFASLNYPFVVEGTKWDIALATNKTKSWITGVDKLTRTVIECKGRVEEKNQILIKHYTQTIKDVSI